MSAYPHIDEAIRNIIPRKMARRTPYWPGPGNVTTESTPLIVPTGHIPLTFVEFFNTWVDNFNEQCIAAGQSPGAQVTMVSVGGNFYKLRAVS